MTEVKIVKFNGVPGPFVNHSFFEVDSLVKHSKKIQKKFFTDTGLAIGNLIVNNERFLVLYPASFDKKDFECYCQKLKTFEDVVVAAFFFEKEEKYCFVTNSLECFDSMLHDVAKLGYVSASEDSEMFVIMLHEEHHPEIPKEIEVVKTQHTEIFYNGKKISGEAKTLKGKKADIDRLISICGGSWFTDSQMLTWTFSE